VQAAFDQDAMLADAAYKKAQAEVLAVQARKSAEEKAKATEEADDEAVEPDVAEAAGLTQAQSSPLTEEGGETDAEEDATVAASLANADDDVDAEVADSDQDTDAVKEAAGAASGAHADAADYDSGSPVKDANEEAAATASLAEATDYDDEESVGSATVPNDIAAPPAGDSGPLIPLPDDDAAAEDEALKPLEDAAMFQTAARPIQNGHAWRQPYERPPQALYAYGEAFTDPADAQADASDEIRRKLLEERYDAGGMFGSASQPASSVKLSRGAGSRGYDPQHRHSAFGQ